MPDTTAIAIYKMGLDTQDYVRGAAAAKQSTDAVVASAEKLATTEEKVTRATRTSGDELSKLAARYDQRIKLEQRLANEQARMARLEREGVGSPEERARVYSLVETSIRRQIDDLNKQEAAMRKSSTATGLARHEMINLSRQIQDIGVSLAGGQSPFRILVEQGSQIADIFASSKATVGDFFRSISASIGRLGTTGIFAGLIAGVAALATGAVAAALSWGSARSDIEKAMLGIGRASGATVEGIEKIANVSSSAFGLSISEAREFAGILASTGKISADQLEGLTKIGKNLAITLGVDSTEAAKVFGKALSGSAGAIESLNDKLGAFDAATLRRINNLIAQNKLMEAQKIAADGIAEATKNAGQAASTSTNFWTALGNAVSNVWTKIGELASRGTGIGLKLGLDEQVAAAEARLQELGAIREARAPSARGGIDKQMERLVETIRKAKEAQAELTAEAERTAAAIKSIADQKLVRDISPEIAQMEKLRNEAEGMANLMQRIGASGGAGSPLLAALGQTMEQVALSAARANEALKSALTPAARLTAEFELARQSITARTSSERIALAAQQTILQLAGQNVSAAEKKLAVERAVALEIERQAQAHKDNVAALQDQLNVAKAMPGHAQQVAQEEATINALLREGFTLMQAQEQAALQRAIAVEQANRAVDQQIISLRQGVEMERARLEGTEASVAAAQAYANAMRSGASETKAAALAAATLEANLERAQIAAENMANSIARAGSDALGVSSLAGKLASIGTVSGGGPFTGRSGGSFGTDPNNPATLLINAAYRQSALAGKAAEESVRRTQEMQTEYLRTIAVEIAKTTPGTNEFSRSQEEAARMQLDAARAQQDAAQQQAEAAKAAREARISQLDEAVADIVATKLLAGQSAQAVNMLIEQGAIQFGTASTRFQTQLDLYKRAGASNAQTAADIRAGIIGEGARPSELLAALDSLTDAVDANTDAQLGLSPFYTSQGDRQLGYRGYTVQQGASNIPGAGTGGSTTSIPGTGGTSYSPGTGGGIMGGVVNIPGSIGDPVYSTAPEVSYRIDNGYVVRGVYQNGQWIQTGYWDYGLKRWVAGSGSSSTSNTIGPYPTPYMNAQYNAGLAMSNLADGGIMSAQGRVPLRPYQDGGIATQPQIALFGEGSTPEAFVPLKGGAIPVKLIGAANNNKPTNVININAPLVNFMADPTRDEVRQSAFQAAQMFRRIAMGG